jgi:uncharacterized protein (TIGR03067 family)
MRASWFAATVVLLWLAAAVPVPADDKDDDAKGLQGVWVVDPATYKDVKDEGVLKEMKAIRIIIENNSFTMKHPPANEEKGTYRFDMSKKPKQIDLYGDTGQLQAQGIYELEKDRLKLCWDRQFKTRGRPTKFAAGMNGEDPFLIVLVREKK